MESAKPESVKLRPDTYGDFCGFQDPFWAANTVM